MSSPRLVEEPLIDDEFDAVGPKPVGDPEREPVGHQGAREAQRGDHPRELGRKELVRIEPVTKELLEREGLAGDQLDRGVDERDPVAFHAPHDGDPPAPDLGVEKRVTDVDRHLVAQFRQANRVADQQDVGHEGGAYR
jgi:hypothetical protein